MTDWLEIIKPFSKYIGSALGIVAFFVAKWAYDRKKRHDGEKAFAERLSEENQKRQAEFLKREAKKAAETAGTVDSIPNHWDRVTDELLTKKAGANIRTTTHNLHNRKMPDSEG